MKFASLFLLAVFAASPGFGQGSLSPTAAPAPTMKTLDQIASTGIAINATNTPPGNSYQYVISSPGSYYLTGNISGVSQKGGIYINSNGVSINLNGFTMDGGNASGSGSFAISDGTGLLDLHIYNGTIIGWPAGGIDLSHSFNALVNDLFTTNSPGPGMKLSDACVARDCVSRNNQGDNITTGYNSTLTHCVAVGSGAGNGIVLGQDSHLDGCTANFNALAGISAGLGATIDDCTANENVGVGLSTDSGSKVTAVSAYKNQGSGIICGAGCVLTGCSAYSNSGAASASAVLGGGSCTFTGCVVCNNTVQFGLTANPGSLVEHCTVSSNTSAQPISAGILISASLIKDCTVNYNTNTNGTTTRTTGMGIYANGTGTCVDSCVVQGNKGDGIDVGAFSRIVNSYSLSNGGAGIHTTSTDGCVDGNQVCVNAVGVQLDGTVNLVTRNVARDNTTNYVIVAGNRVSTIVTPAVNTAISGNSGGTAFSTDGSANVAY